MVLKNVFCTIGIGSSLVGAHFFAHRGRVLPYWPGTSKRDQWRKLYFLQNTFRYSNTPLTAATPPATYTEASKVHQMLITVHTGMTNTFNVSIIFCNVFFFIVTLLYSGLFSCSIRTSNLSTV